MSKAEELTQSWTACTLAGEAFRAVRVCCIEMFRTTRMHCGDVFRAVCERCGDTLRVACERDCEVLRLACVRYGVRFGALMQYCCLENVTPRRGGGGVK